jgi:hypothetical protein
MINYSLLAPTLPIGQGNVEELITDSFLHSSAQIIMAPISKAIGIALKNIIVESAVYILSNLDKVLNDPEFIEITCKEIKNDFLNHSIIHHLTFNEFYISASKNCIPYAEHENPFCDAKTKIDINSNICFENSILENFCSSILNENIA